MAVVDGVVQYSVRPQQMHAVTECELRAHLAILANEIRIKKSFMEILWHSSYGSNDSMENISMPKPLTRRPYESLHKSDSSSDEIHSSTQTFFFGIMATYAQRLILLNGHSMQNRLFNNNLIVSPLQEYSFDSFVKYGNIFEQEMNESQLIETDSDGETRMYKSEDEALHERGFKLIKELGEGAFSRVFLAAYRSSNSSAQKSTTKTSVFLACKIINTKTTASIYKRKFLLRELETLCTCSHPHIIFVHSIFTRNNKYFIFMRYAEKGDLFDYLVANGALTEEQCAVWVRQLASAIQYLHTLEIAHRDLKCENVLITQNFNVKLSDFGFVRSCIDDQSMEVTLSQTFCGSLTYVSPEIIKGSPYEPKIADMWSFGVLIFMMLNKAHPFDSTHLQSLYQNQIKRNWKFTNRKVDSVSHSCREMINSLMEPCTKKRWTIENVLACDWLKMILKEAVALTQDEQNTLDEARAWRKRIETTASSSGESNRMASTLSKINMTINNKEFKSSPFNQSDLNELLATAPK